MVDAGTIWVDDVHAAASRLSALEDQSVVWLEEPFVGGATDAYAALSTKCRHVKLAGGEGASDYYAARHLIDHGGIGFVQIDTGRVGGIGPAKAVADYAFEKGVKYVNHTFTTHLALSASLAPFAGQESNDICEYPVEPSTLASSLTIEQMIPADDGIHLPQRPGLGIQPDPEIIRRYLVDVEITVSGKTLYHAPTV